MLAICEAGTKSSLVFNGANKEGQSAGGISTTQFRRFTRRLALRGFFFLVIGRVSGIEFDLRGLVE